MELDSKVGGSKFPPRAECDSNKICNKPNPNRSTLVLKVVSFCILMTRLQKLRTANERLSKEIKEKEDDNIILRKQIRDLKSSIAETQRNYDAIAKVSLKIWFLSNTFPLFAVSHCLKPFTLGNKQGRGTKNKDAKAVEKTKSCK